MGERTYKTRDTPAQKSLGLARVDCGQSSVQRVPLILPKLEIFCTVASPTRAKVVKCSGVSEAPNRVDDLVTF